MTIKQKDNLSLERAYLNIVEAATKCSECGCNPSDPKEGCDCEHHNEKSETVAEAKKNKKPEWLFKKGAKKEDSDTAKKSKDGKDKNKSKTKDEQVETEVSQLDESFNPVISAKATRQALEDLYAHMSKPK